MRTKNREGVGGWARVERLSECWCVGIWALKLFWSKRGQKQSMQMCGLVGMKLRANVEQYFWIIGCGVDEQMWSSNSESLGMELTSECGAVILNQWVWSWQANVEQYFWIIGYGVDKRMWSSTSESLGMELTSDVEQYFWIIGYGVDERCGAVLLNHWVWSWRVNVEQ